MVNQQEQSDLRWRKKRVKINMDPRKSMGVKLFLFFFITVFVIVGVVGTQSYRIAKDSILDEVSNSSEQTIIQARKNLDLVFDKYKDYSLEYIADENFMNNLKIFVEKQKGSLDYLSQQKEITANIRKTLSSMKNINGVTVFNLDGTGAASTYQINMNAIDKQDWFKSALNTRGEDMWIPSRQAGFVGGKNSIGLVRVLRDYDGPIAVLLVEINVDALASQLNDMKLTSSSAEGKGGIMMFDPASQGVIYAKDASQIGEQSHFMEFDDYSPDSVEGVFTTKQADGNNYLAIYNQSEVTGWVLTGEVRISDLLSSADRILLFIIIALALSAAVSILLGYIMVRIFANPLTQLKDLMNEGARGNLTVRIPVTSKDEIGQLGTSFNQMMEGILILVQQTGESAKQVMNSAIQLTESSKLTSASATEISAATEQIAQGATSLAREAERGNDLSGIIINRMENVVESNLEMNRAANEVNQFSGQGAAYMEELMEKTKSAEMITRDMMNKVNGLRETTSSINNILSVMSALTQQTNILSLNATIEAARAGEAGRGFAVVANEIRKLADESKQSIEVVGSITKKIQEEMNNTVDTLVGAYPLYQSQAEKVRDTSNILIQVKEQMDEFIQKSEEVTDSVQELNRAQQELNASITNVSAVSEETSASAQQVASISIEQLGMSNRLVDLSTELDNLSEALQKSLSSFRI
ncbi:methyl-accepting chemotaxis protein [Paenibacillus graminis]|uniref:methyl-accepting chemotaxis protein n=1 Tax=Paenibacillus graminis TaxID=189425 RepID=UPI002DBC4CF2|nr:methyl-accepting chemotaxis protein [Paenibacillus graminis]MEC0170659.1 methyl-accepting chemotaxis protein [Paenibacillus graminis]